MRNLIQSLQNHNQQLKMESARYKRRLKETQVEMGKVSWCLLMLLFKYHYQIIFWFTRCWFLHPVNHDGYYQGKCDGCEAVI